MGTESAELLIEEYHLIKKILESGDVKEAIEIEARQKAASDLLLKKRDAFIAERIATTLQRKRRASFSWECCTTLPPSAERYSCSLSRASSFR